MIVRLSLLRLDAVNLINEALLHFWRYRNVYMDHISILVCKLLIDLDTLVIKHNRTARSWIFLISSSFGQLSSYLILKLLICHHREVVESARRNTHFFKLLPSIGMDRERQLDSFLLNIRRLYLDRIRMLFILISLLLPNCFCLARFSRLLGFKNMCIHRASAYLTTTTAWLPNSMRDLVRMQTFFHDLLLHARSHRTPTCGLISHFLEAFIFCLNTQVLAITMRLLHALRGVLEIRCSESRQLGTGYWSLLRLHLDVFSLEISFITLFSTTLVAEPILHRVIEISGYPSFIRLNKVVRVNNFLFICKLRGFLLLIVEIKFIFNRLILLSSLVLVHKIIRWPIILADWSRALLDLRSNIGIIFWLVPFLISVCCCVNFFFFWCQNSRFLFLFLLHLLFFFPIIVWPWNDLGFSLRIIRARCGFPYLGCFLS